MLNDAKGFSRIIIACGRTDLRRGIDGLAAVVLDRLGHDVMLIPDGDGHFTVRASVVVSPQFFAWVCGFGDLAQIVAPDDVVAQMKEHIEKIAKMYEA